MMEGDHMEKLLDEYRERFGEQFPLMLCRGIGDDAVCDIIRKCLEDGEPYNPELDPESNY
jgi:hypothetical protein